MPAQTVLLVVVVARVVGMPEVHQHAGEGPAAPREDAALEDDPVAGDAGLEQRGAQRRSRLEERALGLGWRGLVVIAALGGGHEGGPRTRGSRGRLRRGGGTGAGERT